MAWGANTGVPLTLSTVAFALMLAQLLKVQALKSN